MNYSESKAINDILELTKITIDIKCKAERLEAENKVLNNEVQFLRSILKERSET